MSATRQRVTKPRSLLLRAVFATLLLSAGLEAALGWLLARPELADLELAPHRFVLDGLRSIYAREDWSVPQADVDLVVYDTELTYRLRSGSGRFTNREFDTTLEVNSAGLRDDEASLEAPELIVLGDSYAMGWGVAQHQSFPEVLEQRTGSRVLNAAMSSYGTARQILLLDRLDTSRTQAVVVQYFQNDYAENRAYLDAPFELEVTPQLEFEAYLRAFERQTTYRFLDYLRAFADRRSFFPELEGVAPLRVAEALLDVLESSEALQDLPIVLLQILPWGDASFDVMPAVDELLAGEDYAELGERLVPVPLEGRLGSDDYFRLDPHLRAGGHARVAIAVEETLTPLLKPQLASPADESTIVSSASPTPSSSPTSAPATSYKIPPPMTDRDPTTLDAYIERVMTLRDERRSTPTDDERRQIALDLGLSEEDLAGVEQAADDHFVRGSGFLEHRRFDDAVTELGEAVALAPRRVERLHALSQAHLGRWQERRDVADRDRAEILARECLELDPQHAASFEVLNQLDTRSPRAVSRPTGSSRKTMAGLALLALLGLGLLTFMRASEDADEPVSPSPATEPAVSESTPDAPDIEPASEPVSGTQELDLPVELVAGSTGLDLELEPRLSRLKNYSNGSSFWTLNAILTQRGASELDTLSARLELLDAEGQVVSQETVELLNRAAPTLRPGDSHALHLLRETSGDVSRARLVAEAITEQPAAASYADAAPVEFTWRADRPADLEIAVRERSRRFSENRFLQNAKGYFDVVLEVENTSQRTLRRLKLAAEITGPGEAWTAEEENHVVLSSGPAMRPGEVRLVRVLEAVQGQPESYWISVVDVE
ncbi:MAG: hypothetical protein AAF560_12010 [Acidobacteriota bacterium]